MTEALKNMSSFKRKLTIKHSEPFRLHTDWHEILENLGINAEPGLSGEKPQERSVYQPRHQRQQVQPMKVTTTSLKVESNGREERVAVGRRWYFVGLILGIVLGATTYYNFRQTCQGSACPRGYGCLDRGCEQADLMNMEPTDVKPL